MHPLTSTPRPAARLDQPTVVPESDRLRAITQAALDRGDRVSEESAALWRAFRTLWERQQRDPRSTARCAVLANLVALAIFNDPEDYRATADLHAQLGVDRLARLQHRASLALESDPELPWTTLAVGRLVSPRLATRLTRVASSAQEVDRLVTTCRLVAQTLLVQDIDPDDVDAPLVSVLDFLDAVDNGSIIEWRKQLGAIAASPWGPYTEHLLVLARESGLERSIEVIESSIELCREWSRDRERDQVANEIRRLVAVSGVSQRAFAARIGTSPSRLSTYASGAVTPSAAILLRIQRASVALQGESLAPPRPQQRPRRSTVSTSVHR